MHLQDSFTKSRTVWMKTAAQIRAPPPTHATTKIVPFERLPPYHPSQILIVMRPRDRETANAAMQRTENYIRQQQQQQQPPDNTAESGTVARLRDGTFARVGSIVRVVRSGRNNPLQFGAVYKVFSCFHPPAVLSRRENSCAQTGTCHHPTEQKKLSVSIPRSQPDAMLVAC